MRKMQPLYPYHCFMLFLHMSDENYETSSPFLSFKGQQQV